MNQTQFHFSMFLRILQTWRREIEIQSHCRHVNILRLYTIFHDQFPGSRAAWSAVLSYATLLPRKRVYLCLEMAPGGELYGLLQSRGTFSEVPCQCEMPPSFSEPLSLMRQARSAWYFKQMVEALAVLRATFACFHFCAKGASPCLLWGYPVLSFETHHSQRHQAWEHPDRLERHVENCGLWLGSACAFLSTWHILWNLGLSPARDGGQQEVPQWPGCNITYYYILLHRTFQDNLNLNYTHL